MPNEPPRVGSEKGISSCKKIHTIELALEIGSSRSVEGKKNIDQGDELNLRKNVGNNDV
jgi:hypothetical protein